MKKTNETSNMKMAIVGCEASGKTVFMCALADYYGLDATKNPLRLKLTPENSAANSFERYQFRQMRTMHQWPPATPPERNIEMKWSLRAEGMPVVNIDMLEFGGETYRAAFRDNDNATTQDKSVQELLTYLSGADFFVVLVSIKALLTNSDILSDKDYDRETEALWVTRGIIEFIRKKRPDAGIVIGLTQADKFRDEIADAGGPQQLFAARWPTVAAAAQDIQVVEVASVSKTDDMGNPADGYHTHGILPVMKAFSKHCFGDENALETGAKKLTIRKSGKESRRGIAAALSTVILGALGFVAWNILQSQPCGSFNCSECEGGAKTVAASSVTTLPPVTNTVEKVVEKIVTNTIMTVIDRPITNTVEKVVEKVVNRPVTNMVEKVVEKVVTNQVTTVVEKPVLIEKTITNVIERVIERPVTPAKDLLPQTVQQPPVTVSNAVVKASEEDIKKQVPSGYRIWTDYNGRKIIAKWTGVAVDESGITILTRYNRRIDAVLWKFSKDDQEYIKAELKKHAERGEIMSDGNWVRNPMLKAN